MDTTSKYVLYGVGGLLALGALSMLTTPKVASQKKPRTARELHRGDRFIARSADFGVGFPAPSRMFVAIEDANLNTGTIYGRDPENNTFNVPLSAVVSIEE